MLNIVEKAVTELRPWEGNPRVNNHAVQAVVRSIRTFGFNVPILCDPDNVIIAGHTRWKAARELGIDRVPVIVLDLPSAERRAFSIADNKTGELADWDMSALQAVLEELHSEDIDLQSLGYSEPELRALLEPERDFDWDAFDAEARGRAQRGLSFLLVKVPIEMKARFRAAIAEHAKAHGISAQDGGVLAGQVFGHLLRLG